MNGDSHFLGCVKCRIECVMFKAFMEVCYLYLVKVCGFFGGCFFFTRDVGKPQFFFFIALFFVQLNDFISSNTFLFKTFMTNV